jgi:type IX secretion system PorP/SprF family membrane protein
MRKFFFISLILTGTLFGKAQDPNFSQFFVSPLTLNPALTGKFDGNYRLGLNFRNQWPSINNAFKTYTASFDASILKNHIPDYDQFGIGVLALTDKSGNGVLQHNYVGLSTAYHKALDESGFHQIGLGFQGVYVSKRLDVNSLKFEDMLRSDGFTGLTQEDFTNFRLNLSYFDLNAGFFYNGTTDGANNFYLGGSMYHINRHEETFTDTGHYYMASRLTLQGGGMVPLGDYNAFHFSAMHSRQANAVNTVIGGAYMLNINPDEWSPTNLYLGTWFRFGDAVIPYVGLEFGEFRVGASYDVNVSGLKPASNMRGGAEFSLIYVKRPLDPNAKKLNCPKF